MPARGPKVLVVDDEAGIRQSLCGVLSDENYQCNAVGSAEACLEELERESYEAVLLDIWLPGMDGLSALSFIQELPAGSRPAVIMISGHGNIETAVKATKLGAFDFVEKPLTIDKVSLVLKNALQQRRMDLELQRLREETAWPELIGVSVAIKALRQQLNLMAAT
jgi:two-component system, NtrC family, nitrogen regulation response regulator NtrX